jgi:hypothetical protein
MLSDADLNKIGELFDTKIKALEKRLAASVSALGKRVQRLEDGFTNMVRVARKEVIQNAKARHDTLLRAMFNESTLVAVPPLSEDQHGRLSRPAAACNLTDVTNKIANSCGDEVKFEVEPTNVGYRILLANFSSQSRRKAAAKIISTCRKDMQESLGLLLQYDKPHELRFLQRDAYKFLAVVQKRSRGVVTSKQLKQGFIVINGVRFAPEYLVPGPGRWDALADAVIEKVRSWRGNPPLSPDSGVLTDLFGHAYAEEQGILGLEQFEMEEDAMEINDDMKE